MDKIKKDIKDIVREKYSTIARQSSPGCGCGCSCESDEEKMDYSIMSDDYSNLKGYNPDADLSLGCGLPTEFALLKEGDTVLDLGSGAGNDCFVARAEVSESGRVIGLDFSDEMLQKAIQNTDKMGYKNVEFYLGDIENIPLDDNIIDVVISNCVLNLVPDKKKAFSEIQRVLKPNAHFSVSDIVLKGQLPEELISDAEMYAGCVAGALQKEDYLNIIKETGFKEIMVQKEKEIILPDEVLKNYFSAEKIAEFKNSNVGIYSIHVFAKKQFDN